MSVLDCWLAGAYRLYVLEGNPAQAVAGIKAIIANNAALTASAQAKLDSITDDMKKRDFVSKTHAEILSSALG